MNLLCLQDQKKNINSPKVALKLPPYVNFSYSSSFDLKTIFVSCFIIFA